MKTRTIRARVLLQVKGEEDLINALLVEDYSYEANVTALDARNIFLQKAMINIKGVREHIKVSWVTAVAGDGSRVQLKGSDSIPFYAQEIELTCVMGEDFKFDAHKPLPKDPQKESTSSTQEGGAKKDPDKQYSPTLLFAAIYISIGSVGLQLALGCVPPLTSKGMALKLGETALFGVCATLTHKNPMTHALRHMPEITCAIAYLFLSVAANSYLPSDLISDSTRKAINNGANLVQAASCAVLAYSLCKAIYKEKFEKQARDGIS